MNWKRGFHRLFLVLAALWIAFEVFIRADQLDGHLYFRQSALEGQVAMDTKALAPSNAAMGTTLSRGEFIRRYGAESYAAGKVYLDENGDPVRAQTVDLDTFVEEHIKRDKMSAEIPLSTLSPVHVVVVDYSEAGQKIVLPKGYVLETAPASRKVNLAGVGVIQFPGDLDDATIIRILTHNFARPQKYDVFDLVAAEGDGKKAALDQKQKELAAVIEARLFRHRLVSIFDAEHRSGTLAIVFIPPTAMYALFAGAFLALRWIARGFRSVPTASSKSEPQGPTS